MIDQFTSAISDCQNAFFILCEVLNSNVEVTLSIVKEFNPISAGGGGGGGIHPPPGFSQAIATKINRSTPNFLTFNFYY